MIREMEGARRLPLGRLIGALVVALLGFVIYMSQTQVNPVTGEKQHVAMSVDQEMALGLQAAPQMAAENGGRCRCQPRSSRGTRRGGRRTARAQQRRQEESLRG